jgi:peroxiredoxin
MPASIVDELEHAFEQVRDEDLPLAERLAFIANRVRELSATFAEAVDQFIGQLEAAAAGSRAPNVGDVMPGFLLPDENGKLVSMDALLREAPLVVAFHRGHWCPYCRLNAVGLAEIEDEIQPVRIAAVSAETAQFTKQIKAESKARFPFLTDFGNGYALSLNLAVWVPEFMSALIKGAGWDIPKYQGHDGWILPIPSVFLVGQDGRIEARHVDPDYRRRMELADIVAIAKPAALGHLDGNDGR